MIVITGASKGIGKYFCKDYLQKSKEVFAVYNITTCGSNKLKYNKINTTEKNSIQEWLSEYSEVLKYLTLMKCAAINYNSFVQKADVKDRQQMVHANLFGSFNVITDNITSKSSLAGLSK